MSSREVRRVVAGPTCFICDGCIDICADIVADRIDDAPASLKQQLDISPSFRCNLCLQLRPAEGGLRISQRGALCLECVEAVKAADAGESD
jgi:hypothetical protein